MPAPPPVRLGSIAFTGGQEIVVDGADLIVIVGPNNSGKTRTLIELQQALSRHPSHLRRREDYLAVEGFTLSRKLTLDELTSWLDENRYSYLQQNPDRDAGCLEQLVTGARWDTTS